MLSAVKGLPSYKLVNCLLEQALAEETCASSIQDWHFKRREDRERGHEWRVLESLPWEVYLLYCPGWYIFSQLGNLLKSIANNSFLSYEKSILYISFSSVVMELLTLNIKFNINVKHISTKVLSYEKEK